MRKLTFLCFAGFIALVEMGCENIQQYTTSIPDFGSTTTTVGSTTTTTEPPPVTTTIMTTTTTLAVPSNFFTLATTAISDVQPDVLQAKGAIEISWGLDSRSSGTYNVYRSRYKDFGAGTSDLSKIKKIADGLISNHYTDTTILNNSAYYYMISWVDSGTEYKMSGLPALGFDNADTQNKDVWEPDNQIAQAHSLTIDASDDSTALLYNVQDLATGIDTDQDWFKVMVPTVDANNDETFTVHVTLLDSSLDPSNIQFKFSCQGNTYAIQGMSSATKDFAFSSFSNTSNPVPLYFQISLKNTLASTFVGRYTIQVRKGL